jgi:hypothetical protein
MKTYLKVSLLILIHAIAVTAAEASVSAVRERGGDRKITLEIENGTATFGLVEGMSYRELRRVEIKGPDDDALRPRRQGVEGFPRTEKVTEGYVDLTFWLVENLDMGIIFLPFISVPAYAGYSMSYLYAVPADLLSREGVAHRKYLRLVHGKTVSTSKKTFALLLRDLQ